MIKQMKTLVSLAAGVIFLICLYSFLLGNKVFEGKFDNEYISWYFLAKGIFCSIGVYLLALILEALLNKERK